MTVYFSTRDHETEDKSAQRDKEELLSEEQFTLSDEHIPDYIKLEGLHAHGNAMLLQHAVDVGKMCADFGAKADIKVTSYLSDDGSQVIETKIYPAHHEDYSTFIMLPAVGKTVSVRSDSAEETFLAKVKADNIHTGKQKVSQYNRKVTKQIVDAALAHPKHVNAVNHTEIQQQRDAQRQHVLTSLKQDRGYVTNLISFIWSFVSHVICATIAMFCVLCNAVIDILNYLISFISEFRIIQFKSFSNLHTRMYAAMSRNNPLIAIQKVIYRLLYVSY